MSDVVKVVMIRFNAMRDGATYEEAVEMSRNIQLTGSTDEPAVVDVDLDEDDEDEAPRPKRKTASRKKTSKR